MAPRTRAVLDLAFPQEDYINAFPQEDYINVESPDEENCIELPEFHGKYLAEEEVLDWIFTVEETLKSKRVPLDMITTRFRGRAATWWSQLNARSGKPKITSWDKLKKKMRKSFLPFNYDHMMLQRLYTFRQGPLYVKDYYTEFCRLSTRVDVQESEQQTVARYVVGLHKPIQEYFKLFNPLTLSEAYQHAIAAEAQLNDEFSLEINRGEKIFLVIIGIITLISLLVLFFQE